MQKYRLFIGGIYQKEYEGPDYGYENLEIKRIGNFKEINFPLKSNLKFYAFIDGTMKLYWVSDALKSGTPLFYASIAVALVYRTNDSFLKNTSYTRNINLILFPFKAYKEAFPLDFGTAIDKFLINLKKELKSFGTAVFTEDDIRNILKTSSIESIFGHKDSWIICDTTYSGISKEIKRQINISDLGKWSEIKNKARARVRHYMRLLEFFALKTFRERNPNSLVMVDGLFARKNQVQTPFMLKEGDYNEITKGFIGFVKRPMEIPLELKKLYNKWSLLIPGKAIYWEASLKDKENKDSDVYTFSLMRFRYFKELKLSPAGIVKLQANKTTDENFLKEILSAVYRERIPYVSDPRRSLNEAYPIEIAERIAKSFFPSEARIRGFLSRLIPEVPLLDSF